MTQFKFPIVHTYGIEVEYLGKIWRRPKVYHYVSSAVQAIRMMNPLSYKDATLYLSHYEDGIKTGRQRISINQN